MKRGGEKQNLSFFVKKPAKAGEFPKLERA
jgi:hypothetical protein